MFDSSIKAMEALQKAAVREALKSHIVKSEGFQNLSNSTAGTPVLIYSPDDLPEYWMVPYVSGTKVIGHALFDGRQKLIRVGIFDMGGDSGTGYIDSSYFTKPPSDLLEEIRGKYPGYALSKPVFSYDRTPARWSWRLGLTNNYENHKLIFILPGSWYEADEKKGPEMGMEG